MKGPPRTDQELFEEISALKQKIKELERSLAKQGRTEDALRKSEEDYRNIYDNAMVGIFQSTPAGRYLRVNSALASMHGFSSPDEMMHSVTNIGKQLYVDPEERKRYMELLTKDDMIRAFEAQLYRKDGSRIWLSMNVKVVRHQDGSVAFYEGIVEDISERKRAEKALLESEARYREFANSLPQTVVECDEKGSISFANINSFTIFGYTKEDLDRGLNIFQMIVPGNHDRAKDNIRHVFLGKQTGNEYTALRKDGSTFPILVYTTPIVRENMPVNLRVILIDITERKRAEEELRESQRRLADIIEFLPDATLAIDNEGKVIAWNRAIETMTGVMKEDMLGKGDHEYAVPFYGTRRPILINFVSTWDKDMEKQYSFIKKEGDTLFTETNVPFVRGQNRVLWGKARPLYDTQGNITGAIESIRDITERKEAEKALEAESTRRRILFEQSPDGVLIIDPQNARFLDFNTAAHRQLGYSREEFAQLNVFDIEAMETAEETKARIAEVSRGGKADFETLHRTRQGEIRNVHVTTQILDIQGNPVYHSVWRDITERKRLEAQLLNAQKMEAVGTLSGGIAHDFNNILMGIQGYASLMLLGTDTGHPHYEWLKQIEELVRNAADLTGQLLGFARGGKYVVKPFNMNELIEKTSRMFGRTKKEIVIHRKYEGDIWTAEGDRGQIEQVLLNLYLNAWQAMPAGGDLSLETKNVVVGSNDTITHSISPGRYVCTSISDTGMGMDEKTKKRIFEPFFTTKELGRGTGLGLAMVYGIIKNHNGHIDVISEPGEGTTFSFYLPASGKDVAKEKPEVPEIMRGTETILLIDDEPGILAVSKTILESLGYSVYEAKSGKEAILLYREKKDEIGLVVLDMIMPGLSGSETFDIIREINPAARIILSSGYSLNDQAQQIMDKGCRGFIQKPFNISSISRMIREVLET